MLCVRSRNDLGTVLSFFFFFFWWVFLFSLSLCLIFPRSLQLSSSLLLVTHSSPSFFFLPRRSLLQRLTPREQEQTRAKSLVRFAYRSGARGDARARLRESSPLLETQACGQREAKSRRLGFYAFFFPSTSLLLLPRVSSTPSPTLAQCRRECSPPATSSTLTNWNWSGRAAVVWGRCEGTNRKEEKEKLGDIARGRFRSSSFPPLLSFFQPPHRHSKKKYPRSHAPQKHKRNQQQTCPPSPSPSRDPSTASSPRRGSRPPRSRRASTALRRRARRRPAAARVRGAPPRRTRCAR